MPTSSNLEVQKNFNSVIVNKEGLISLGKRLNFPRNVDWPHRPKTAKTSQLLNFQGLLLRGMWSIFIAHWVCEYNFLYFFQVFAWTTCKSPADMTSRVFCYRDTQPIWHFEFCYLFKYSNSISNRCFQRSINTWHCNVSNSTRIRQGTTTSILHTKLCLQYMH